MTADTTPNKRKKFPPIYWLTVIFEFFERGSYYGMMSILSVYLVDELHFAKQDVGIIKSLIQPLLYFLPILAGALADRFGYRRMLTLAFALLGCGYMLTSQAQEYTWVLLALVVMATGAGFFKPIISGTIARCTDKSNATLGFGIFYWSINLGAFLFPLILVPLLRDNLGYSWVFIASAIGTGAMLVPTFLFYRDPAPDKSDPNTKENQSEKKPGLLLTMANAFEIIYSPLVLVANWARASLLGRIIAFAGISVIIGLGIYDYLAPQTITLPFSAQTVELGTGGEITLRLESNYCRNQAYSLNVDHDAQRVELVWHRLDQIDESYASVLIDLARVDFIGTIDKQAFSRMLHLSRQALFDPQSWPDYLGQITEFLQAHQPASLISAAQLKQTLQQLSKTILEIEVNGSLDVAYSLTRTGSWVQLRLKESSLDASIREKLRLQFAQDPQLKTLTMDKIEELANSADSRSILFLYIGLLFIAGLVVIRLARKVHRSSRANQAMLAVIAVATLSLVCWLLPGLSMVARVVLTLTNLSFGSLVVFDYQDQKRFSDHFRFLLMIFIYSGFWILYFQMFDSVLWYVQAYVNPDQLNRAVNQALDFFGVGYTWHFNVEIVTVINALTIILLQLLVSWIVKNTRALPTMITGIALGTSGMAVLAISTDIWVFLVGIIIFSIGEMVAHPKFIAYVGQIAPKSRAAMYMGYLFLYGVIGASIGGVLGANLYVEFVEVRSDPQSLWLVFSSIGVVTIIGLLIYNRTIGRSGELAE